MTGISVLANTIVDISLQQAPRDLEERRFWASRCLNALRPHSGTVLVSRTMTKIALTSAVPANARFVTDVLMESDQWDLARIFAETAEGSATKGWQKRRLATLKEHKASTETFGRRHIHEVFLGRDGLGSDSPGSTPVEDWFREWLPRLAESPVGLLPDPLLLRCTEDARFEDLAFLLLLLSCMPVVPIVCSETMEQASQVQRQLCAGGIPWGWESQPVVFAVRADPKRHVLVGLLDEEPLSLPVGPHACGLTCDELCGLALVTTVVRSLDTPVLRKRWSFALNALYREAGPLFPRWGRQRLMNTALNLLFEGQARAQVSQILAGLLLNNGHFDEALGLLKSVPPADAGPYYTRRTIRALYGVGEFQSLADSNWEQVESAAERHQVAEARAAQKMLHELERLSREPVRRRPDAVPNKVVSILHASQPVQSGGYANRAHQILDGMNSHGFEVVAFTRPGFPEPTNTLRPGEVAPADHDGVAYRRIGVERSRPSAEYQYMLECVNWYREILTAENPSVVHLRSTYVSALPGLIAAHSLGIPAVYEVSGMWELVYASKDSGRMESRRARTVILENAVLHHADAVTTLTDAMRQIIIDRTEMATPPSLLPNAVDSHRFTPRPRDMSVLAQLNWPTDTPVIGYAGSFVDYEGLDLLIDALAILRERGMHFRALLIGDGATHAEVVDRAQRKGLADWICFTGRVPHQEVDRLYSVIDLCAYPRRLTTATVAVSPLKPFEAMALRKTVLVSDVPALAEIAGNQERAMVFAHDDAGALADALGDAIRYPDAAERRKDAARNWVETERSWNAVGEAFATILKETSLKENNSHG